MRCWTNWCPHSSGHIPTGLHAPAFCLVLWCRKEVRSLPDLILYLFFLRSAGGQFLNVLTPCWTTLNRPSFDYVDLFSNTSNYILCISSCILCWNIRLRNFFSLPLFYFLSSSWMLRKAVMMCTDTFLKQSRDHFTRDTFVSFRYICHKVIIRQRRW